MNDHIEGTDIAANVLWQAKPEEDHWISTGIGELFITHIDLRGVLDFYLGRYPGTHVIRGLIANKYFVSNLADMARSLMLDSVVAVIQPSRPTDQTTAMTGGEKMDAPPDVRCGSCGQVPNPISAPCLDCPDWDDKER